MRAKIYTKKGWAIAEAADVHLIWKLIKPFCKPNDRICVTTDGLGIALYDLIKVDGFHVIGIKYANTYSVLMERSRNTIGR